VDDWKCDLCERRHEDEHSLSYTDEFAVVRKSIEIRTIVILNSISDEGGQLILHGKKRIADQAVRQDIQGCPRNSRWKIFRNFDVVHCSHLRTPSLFHIALWPRRCSLITNTSELPSNNNNHSRPIDT
jgi:hypothetical protein